MKHHARTTKPTRAARTLCLAGVLLAGAALPGCFLSPLLRASELKGDHTVEPKYTDLQGKSFAVIVAVDRSIQADYTQLVGQITTTVSMRLKDKVGASGWIPPESVLGFQYQHPDWNIWTLDRLVKELKVDRLIFVDVQEFRLNESGNQYLWRGAASGLVGVVEADGPFSDNFAFQEHIDVHFPTKETALGPNDASAGSIQIELAKRFVDRVSWMFYQHTEANVIDY